jgi:hypothetical protein
MYQKSTQKRFLGGASTNKTRRRRRLRNVGGGGGGVVHGSIYYTVHTSHKTE